jgi:hypothetical protein
MFSNGDAVAHKWLPGTTRRKPLAGLVPSMWIVNAVPGQMSRCGTACQSACQPIRV